MFLLFGICCRTGGILKREQAKGQVLLLVPVSVNCLHNTAAFTVLSLQHGCRGRGFPADQAFCCHPELPTFSSCMRNWNKETSFECHTMEVVSRWASLLANLVNTINSNWKCDWPVPCVLYTQNECTVWLVMSIHPKNASKKEQSITKKRI